MLPTLALTVPAIFAEVAVNTPALVTLKTELAPNANPSVPKYRNSRSIS